RAVGFLAFPDRLPARQTAATRQMPDLIRSRLDSAPATVGAGMSGGLGIASRPPWRLGKGAWKMRCAQLINRAVTATVGMTIASASASAALPLVAGNYSIAQQFMHGDAHVVILGDSIQNGLYGLYPSIWKIDKWS